MDQIVGVIGGTDPKPSRAVLDVVTRLGRRLADSGAVVLTGGRHDEVDRDTVKVRALVGALEVSGGHHPGRVMGVLKNDGGLEIAQPGIAYVGTGLSHLRNLLNGLVPDIVIALPGGRGTLSEIYFADCFDRSVVLLGWTEDDVVAQLPSHEAWLDALVRRARSAGFHASGSPGERISAMMSERTLRAAGADDAVDAVGDLPAGRGALALDALSADGWLRSWHEPLHRQLQTALDHLGLHDP